MIELTLFTTEGCHLCEQAHEILLCVADNHPLDIRLQEIGDDDQLVARYGVRIPVVRFPNNDELDWPFSHADIEKFLA